MVSPRRSRRFPSGGSASPRGVIAALGLLAFVTLLASGCGGGGDQTVTTVLTEAAAVDANTVEDDGAGFDAKAVYEHAAPGVVTIRSVFDPAGEVQTGATGRLQGLGSGFVVDAQAGEIVTNAHVVTDGEAAGSEPLHEAREVYVQFPDRNQVSAEIAGLDPFADVALLRVDPGDLDLTELEFADASELDVGEPVATLGSPFEQRQSISVGIISAIDRSIPSLTQFQIDGAIQTDASINPGNSGGPLLDSRGRVVGINQQIDTTSGGSQGVGFAVPIDLVERSVEQIREDGQVAYAYIGVTVQPLYPQLAEHLDIDADSGALLADVVAGGPAAEAGLKGGDGSIEFQGQEFTTGGDVVVAINGQSIVAEGDLPRIISRLDPGETITLDVIRDGKHQELKVKLGSRPASLSETGEDQ